jgi:uncharacterized protein (DUF1810 family)
MKFERFLTAQQDSFDDACRELSAGRKQSHWMWFIFPQLAALGQSPTAKYYGLADLAEAQAYWTHPVLGERLRHIMQILADQRENSAHRIFGTPDDLKLCSCLTLFEEAAPQDPLIRGLLERFYGGERDRLTLDLLD